MRATTFASLILSMGLCANAAEAVGWVVIPVNEYGALRQRAFPPSPDGGRGAEGLGPEATLTEINYELKLDASTATAAGCATLSVDVLSDGWVSVPVPDGLLVREARNGSALVPLVHAPNGSGMAVLLSHKGRTVLTLDLVFPLVVSGGAERLTLPPGHAAIVRAVVARPSTQEADLRVGGGFVADRTPAGWLVYGRGGGEALVFEWRRRVEESAQPRSELPLRMRGALTQLYGLGEDNTTVQAEVRIDVVQGAAREVRVAIPAGVTINQVPGATVADWDVKNGELLVHFLEPVEHGVTFTVIGEARLAREGSIAIPVMRLAGMERETGGGVAVEVLGAGEIKNSRAKGFDAADAADLGRLVASRQSPSLAAFKLRTIGVGAAAAERTLTLDVARYTQQAVLTANVEEARYRVLVTADGKTLVQARYGVRNNQKTFLRLRLPEGAVIWSSSLSGRPIRPGKAPDGSLLFPLAKGRGGEEAPLFGIEILYLLRDGPWSGLKGHAALQLPALDLPVSKTGVTLYYPPQYRVMTDATGAFRAQEYERPAGELWNPSPASLPMTVTTTSEDAPAAKLDMNAQRSQALVDAFKKTESRRAVAAAPVRVAFPAVGPSVYLVSELTAEGKAATVELNYTKEKERKAGSR